LIVLLDENNDKDRQAVLNICKSDLIVTAGARESTEEVEVDFFEFLDASQHAQVFVLADKYNVKGLAVTAAEKFEDILEDIHVGHQFESLALYVYNDSPWTNDTLRNLIASRVYQELEVFGMVPMVKRSSHLPPILRGISYDFSTLLSLIEDLARLRNRDSFSNTRD
jgi:hypothetical protein